MPYTLSNRSSGGQAAIIAPMAANMDVTSQAEVGVAMKQQIAFVGIESIFETVLDVPKSIELLSCFSIEDKNTSAADNNDTTTNVTPMFDVTLDAGMSAEFTGVMKHIFDNATQKAGRGPTESNNNNASSFLGDGLREELNNLLANNGLADMLEASNVLNISVTMNQDAGSMDMFNAIRGTRAGDNEETAKAKRRLFVTQIPATTLDGSWDKDANNGAGAYKSGYLREGTKRLDFLPLKGGDSMTFVFDITVRPPNSLTATGKNATADNHNGTNMQGAATGSQQGVFDQATGITNFEPFVGTVNLNGTSKIRRVAFVAHLGNKAALFPQDYTTQQYDSIDNILAPGAPKTKANYVTAFNKVAGQVLTTASSVPIPAGLQAAVNAASANLYSTIVAAATLTRDADVTAYNTSEDLLSLETATINKHKKGIALDDLKSKRATISGEADGFGVSFELARTSFAAANATFEAWQNNSGSPAAATAWATARTTARDGINTLISKRSALSGEVADAEYDYADSMNLFYPANGSSPKQLGTLSQELDDAEAAYAAAKANYENGVTNDVTAFNTALSNVRLAEEELARKNFVMSVEMRAKRLEARTEALRRQGANETAIATSITGYNNQYTKAWKKDSNNVTVEDTAPNSSVAPYVSPSEPGSLDLVYTKSFLYINGVVAAPSRTPMDDAEQDYERSLDLLRTINTAVGDKMVPVGGAQADYNSAVEAFNTRTNARNTYDLAVSRFNATTGNTLTQRNLITTGGAAILSAGLPSVADAETAFASAQANLVKKEAHAQVVLARIAAYGSAPNVATELIPNGV